MFYLYLGSPKPVYGFHHNKNKIPVLGNAIPVLGMKPNRGRYVFYFSRYAYGQTHIQRVSARPFYWCGWTKVYWKITENTHYPRFSFILKIGIAFPKTGVCFYYDIPILNSLILVLGTLTKKNVGHANWLVIQTNNGQIYGHINQEGSMRALHWYVLTVMQLYTRTGIGSKDNPKHVHSLSIRNSTIPHVRSQRFLHIKNYRPEEVFSLSPEQDFFKVVGATLVEWTESLKISVASSLGHAESIFHKKTRCHRTQFWNKQDWIIHCSYGKAHILACVCDFLGLR